MQLKGIVVSCMVLIITEDKSAAGVLMEAQAAARNGDFEAVCADSISVGLDRLRLDEIDLLLDLRMSDYEAMATFDEKAGTQQLQVFRRPIGQFSQSA